MITMRIHPLVGQPLLLVRALRRRNGRRDLDLEHPGGWVIRVPESWTDRVVAADVCGGMVPAPRATGWALARLCDTLNDRMKVTIDTAREVGDPVLGESGDHAAALSHDRSSLPRPLVGGTAADEQGRAARNVGRPDPANGGLDRRGGVR